VLLGGAIACSSADSSDDSGAAAASTAKKDEGSLEKQLQKWSDQNQCAGFDYFPNGGIQAFWCHRPSTATLAALQKLAGVDIFSSGPHTNGDLDLHAATFGHYNPAFVQWLVENGVSDRDSSVRKATQSAYDSKLKPLAEVFWKTHAKIAKNSACFEREKSAYADAIANGKTDGFVGRYGFFMNPFYCDHDPADWDFLNSNGSFGDLDPNVVQTVVGFWVRRSLDGTMASFAEGLKKLVTSYEPDLLAPTRDPDPAALTQAVDAVMTAVASCKDQYTGTDPNVAVQIDIGPAGGIAASLPALALAGTPVARCVMDKGSAVPGPKFDGGSLTFHRTVAFK
jgi:hypothetical protein